VPSRFIYAPVLCVLVTSVPAPADILFSDSTFNPGNYNNFSATPNRDPGVTSTYGQCQSCGNPGQALQAVVSIPVTAGGAFVGFLNNTFVYNPQTEGAILSLSASVDKDLTLNRSTTYFASYFYPLIEQGGSFYIASIAGGTINSGTTTGYENIGQAGLTASDFGLYNFGTTSVPDFSINPDFSAGGAAMVFGLAPLVSANDVFTITVNYDNLNYDIVQGGVVQPPVPESSSLVLLSIFVVGLALRGLGPAIRWKLKRR
jgi:hypothetical protein